MDFNAIAPGDAVDEVAHLLESKGIFNYFIEIGGEIRANGKTISGHHWRTAVRTPKEGAGTHEAQRSIELSNISLATSGNYENFHQDKEKGIKYAHTINPFTGFPEKNTLLSKGWHNLNARDNAFFLARDCLLYTSPSPRD